MTEFAKSNGMELAYETFGDPADSPIVLVMGLGTQLIAWPEPFCEELAKAGHYVVRFDNRDIGESTVLTGERAPSIAAVAARRTKPPYTISDMGRDLLGLMDALELETAHLVGASMGGFIAQSAAIQAPERVRSMTLIMTSTGSRLVGRVDLRLIPRLLTRRAVNDRDAAGETAIETFRTIGSPGFEFDTEWYREIGRRSFDRGRDVSGYRRQLSACLEQSDRTARLQRLETPALVIHGLADPLVAPTGGLALARSLRNSRFLGIPGMGHDLPRPLWSEFAGHITELAAKAG
ncbi:MAG: alpha/beta hydrolase [Frankiales bacterium]|nr:alpha/beta hydrolase [Frankiales bacterium]